MMVAWIVCVIAGLLTGLTDGLRGPPGLPGQKGEKGQKGYIGLSNRCRRGPKGENGVPLLKPDCPIIAGLDDRPGYPGSKGDNGVPGLPGVPGISGLTGIKGEEGSLCLDLEDPSDAIKLRNRICLHNTAEVVNHVKELQKNVVDIQTMMTAIETQMTQTDELLTRLDSDVNSTVASQLRNHTFAKCDVQPNPALDPELEQPVSGQVVLWQKETGGPLNVYVNLKGFFVSDSPGHYGYHRPLGHRHGFHVHESGDLSNGCQSTGSHYNPFNVNHGGPASSERHVGDLGMIECDDKGVTDVVFADPVASLIGNYSIVGRALVVHAYPDDYGVNKDDPESQKTGNAGARIACCVIEPIDTIPMETYRSIKSAVKRSD